MIEVGEYVRTKTKGIKRIDTIFENKTVNKYGYEIGSEWDGKLYSTIKTTDIINHSKEPKDLIEVGDYVNGVRMDIVNKDENGHVYYLQNIELPAVNKNEIKTILTKEQYEANCYKV